MTFGLLYKDIYSRQLSLYNWSIL